MKCDHCDREIHPGDMGRVQVTVRAKMTPGNAFAELCGFCAFELGEWLCPVLLDDPVWRVEMVDITLKLKDLYGET